MKKQIVIDENAWNILKEVKKMMQETGIAAPSFSDVIRWMYVIGWGVKK